MLNSMIQNVLSAVNTDALFLQKIIDLAFQVLPKAIWAILLLLLTRWLVGLSKYFCQKVLGRLEPTLQQFLAQAIGIFVWIAGGIGALSAMGFDTTSLVAVIGAAGLAVGLALQNSLSQLAAGILLVSFRPFEVGDAIETGSIAGTVETIGLFSTTVVTNDNTRITVPNASIANSTLKNFTVMGTRRIELKVNIHDRPVQATTESLIALAQSHPAVLLDPLPNCTVSHLRADGTIVVLRPWCQANDYDQTKAELLQTVQEFLNNPPIAPAAAIAATELPASAE
jgi:small conductance mechanosensitive channel